MSNAKIKDLTECPFCDSVKSEECKCISPDFEDCEIKTLDHNFWESYWKD